MTAPPPRIHVLLAREADVGLILRRGPSRWVELLLWDRRSDTFTPGAWFHGRIYERRCDLSPRGDLLVYFAMAFDRFDPSYAGTWTAVSRPPWLTALALWPKGDTWGGGGLFLGDRDLWINHDPRLAEPHEAHQPQHLEITTGARGGWTDLGIEGERLRRAGWSELAALRTEIRSHPVGYVTVEPGRWERPDASESWRLRLTLTTVAYSTRYDYKLVGRSDSVPLAGAEWADWDGDRGVVYAAEGRLFRARVVRSGPKPPAELIDLRGHRPERRRSPAWAREW